MDFVRSHFGKMQLWPVEHFFPHFFSRSVLISADLEKKWGQKCSTGQRFICTEVTSYRIHILVISFHLHKNDKINVHQLVSLFLVRTTRFKKLRYIVEYWWFPLFLIKVPQVEVDFHGISTYWNSYTLWSGQGITRHFQISS